jgi:hypothetical protein
MMVAPWRIGLLIISIVRFGEKFSAKLGWMEVVVLRGVRRYSRWDGIDRKQ